jgi:hypothetical protein
MVATGSFAFKSSQKRDFSTMADVLLAIGGCEQRNIQKSCKKDILVKSNDVSDIVEKFIKVAHGPDALEDNRARENARENIRKKLAMEAAKEKSDSCDLQICFMNEFASDEDLSESKEDIEGVAIAGEEIAKANISQKVSQIIVPINPAVKPSSPNPASRSMPVDNPTACSMLERDPTARFHSEVSRLQAAAQDNLLKARDKARVKIQDQINTRQQNNQKLFSLVGLPQFSKVNRRTISRLNVAQLQLIQNDYLSQIESLNEELVSLLVSRDELVMEQDAMLTDIQDLSEFTNLKK